MSFNKVWSGSVSFPTASLLSGGNMEHLDNGIGNYVS